MVANHQLKFMLLAAAVVCLGSLQRQQLFVAACLRVRDKATREDAGNKEDDKGHKYTRTCRSHEGTGYYITVPAVGP